ncbi:hypothetical protein F4054_21065 [Candidatus Poribacteria bacterium]|nr:hypothetical protein [Candidatus Poribacteria bacterium]MYG06967.1 hypothetical protein [Candidatus Poribacteria bacterium]MYK24737.1 hypothetical protein [Candidatus Poribacteria bacterium]
MEAFKRFIGVVLIFIAAIVAIQTILEPIYHTSTDESPHSSAWDIINPLSAISIIFGLIFGYMRMRGIGENSSVQEFIAANTLFYGFIFIGIVFFWNWFGIMAVASDFTAVGMDTRSLVWILFDAILPPLNIAMGIHLLRASPSSE